MTCEVGDTDNLLKQFNAALYDDMKQAMEEADKAMIEKCKELAHKNMKPLTDLDERVLMEVK